MGLGVRRWGGGGSMGERGSVVGGLGGVIS